MERGGGRGGGGEGGRGRGRGGRRKTREEEGGGRGRGRGQGAEREGGASGRKINSRGGSRRGKSFWDDVTSSPLQQSLQSSNRAHHIVLIHSMRTSEQRVLVYFCTWTALQVRRRGNSSRFSSTLLVALLQTISGSFRTAIARRS